MESYPMPDRPGPGKRSKRRSDDTGGRSSRSGPAPGKVTRVQRRISKNRKPGKGTAPAPTGGGLVTQGGSWRTNTYRVVPDGAEIELEFQPNKQVSATKIGLIQRARKIEKGKNYDKAARETYEHNANPDNRDDQKFQPDAAKRKAQRSDGESHIDRDIRMNNPVYGAPNLKPGQDISKTPKSKLDMSDKAQQKGKASNYQLGYQYKKAHRRSTRSAKLYDMPNMPGATTAARDPDKTSEMTFETTAVALSGKQKGTYYGSVSWGFKITSDKGPTLEPLAVASPGDPTDKMQEVMENWNEGEFEEGQENPTIPLPERED
jgi:hypothetical protein